MKEPPKATWCSSQAHPDGWCDDNRAGLGRSPPLFDMPRCRARRRSRWRDEDHAAPVEATGKSTIAFRLARSTRWTLSSGSKTVQPLESLRQASTYFVGCNQEHRYRYCIQTGTSAEAHRKLAIGARLGTGTMREHFDKLVAGEVGRTCWAAPARLGASLTGTSRVCRSKTSSGPTADGARSRTIYSLSLCSNPNNPSSSRSGAA